MVVLKFAVASLVYAGTLNWWLRSFYSATISSTRGKLRTVDEDVVLIDFSSPESSIPMQTVDDPVMGGTSHSGKSIGPDRLIWKGEVETVDFLDVPGFCNLQTVGHQDFSVLANTAGIAFLIDGSKSDWLHPMGLQIETGYRKFGIPVVYWAPAIEQLINEDAEIVQLYAAWEDFTAHMFGQDVEAPPLDANELAKTNLVGMSTYLSHQTGPFHIELLSVEGRK